MQLRTHLAIDPDWVGQISALEPNRASATLRARPEMAADRQGLVHGGFVFGLTDFAAMAAVNDPNVVLGASEVRFVAPVRVGETITAEAHVTAESGRKRTVDVSARVGERVVLTGTLTAFVLDAHVLGP